MVEITNGTPQLLLLTFPTDSSDTKWVSLAW